MRGDVAGAEHRRAAREGQGEGGGAQRLAQGPAAGPVAPQVPRWRLGLPVPARRRVSARTVALLVAAAFAIVLLVTWGGVGQAIARWLRPVDNTIGPDTPSPEWLVQEQAHKRARELRGAAHVDCATTGGRRASGSSMKRAAANPAGDAEPAVQEDRRAATEALAAPIEVPRDPKAPPGGERGGPGSRP